MPEILPAIFFCHGNSFETEAKQIMISGEYKRLIDYEKLGPEAMISIPTPDHHLPFFYVIATRRRHEVSQLESRRVRQS